MEQDRASTTTTSPNNGVRPAGNVRLSTHMDGKSRVAVDRPKSASIKAVLLGDYGVGKTTLFRRIKEGSDFEPFELGSSSWESQSTDTCCKHIVTTDNREVQLALWDTAGAERYRTLTLDFFRKALIVFLVYRTDNPQTLSNLMGWIEDAQPYLPSGALFVLIGNVYTDYTMMISAETAADFAHTHNISVHVQLPVKSTEESKLTGLLVRSIEEALRIKGTDNVRELEVMCEQESNIRLHDGEHQETNDDKPWWRRCRC